jgi:hypothetical protein
VGSGYLGLNVDRELFLDWDMNREVLGVMVFDDYIVEDRDMRKCELVMLSIDKS